MKSDWNLFGRCRTHAREREQETFNQLAAGSIPARLTNSFPACVALMVAFFAGGEAYA